MRMPVDAAVLGFPNYLTSPDDDGDGSQLREWSSVIGIVTAIVGNILISFALNIQRYAHIRIEREHAASRLPLKKTPNRRNRSDVQNGYGTVQQQQENGSDERVQTNTTLNRGISENGASERHGLLAGNGDEETEGLVQSFESESEDTLAPIEKPSDEERKSYLRSPYWWIGIVLMTIGETGNFIAYGFAPASIVSPLGVVALVSNCMIAPLMLKERFRKRDLCGVLVAIGGAVVVVLSARTREDKLGPDDLWDAIKRWEFLAYILITSVLILALMWASDEYGPKIILVDIGLVGLFGGYTALSTKGVASLLSDTLWRFLTFPITYILLLILVGSALLQIRYLNRALQRFDSTQVIPTQFVLFTLSVIIGSAVLYRDFESMSVERAVKFICGCFLTFLGVYFITGGRSNEDDMSESDISDEEEAVGLLDEEIDSPIRTSYDGRRKSISSSKRRLLPSASFDGPVVRRPSTSDSRRTPTRDSEVPSISFFHNNSEESPSPFTQPAGADSPWADQPSQGSASESAPRLNTTQSATQVETLRSKDRLQGSNNPLIRTPSAPSDPQTPRPGTGSASPSKPDPTSQARITGGPDTPIPATPSRSSRNSITRLLPGPLVSPLSSSLSAVVADSLLRGDGTGSRRRSIRSNRHTIRSQHGDIWRQSLADGDESPRLTRTQSHQVEEDGSDMTEAMDATHLPDQNGKEKKSRFRSVSDTLGSLLGGKKRRKGRAQGHDDDSDDEDRGEGS